MSNQYQLMKLKEFFNVLSQNLVIECFTDKSYKMLVTIPESYVYKSKQNIWLVGFWIAEELFDYLHSFLFSDFFNKKLPMDDFYTEMKSTLEDIETSQATFMVKTLAFWKRTS